MSDQFTPQILDTLVCELGKRPAGAPTIGEIIGFVTELQRCTDTLIVTFEPAATSAVEAVVEAERQCCSTIGWHLEAEDGLRLRISAQPLQLDALEAIFGARAAS